MHVNFFFVTKKVPQQGLLRHCNVLSLTFWYSFNQRLILDRSETSKVEPFCESSQWLKAAIFAKSSILDFWLGSEYVSVSFIIFVDCCCSCFSLEGVINMLLIKDRRRN